MALPTAVFPAAAWDGNEQKAFVAGSTVATKPDQFSQHTDYNETSAEVIAVQNALRAGVIKAFWNETGSTVTKGTLVRITGWNVANSLPTVTKADGVIAASAVPQMAEFVVIADVLTVSVGNMAKEHTISGIDTSASSGVGARAYLGAATGAFTFTPPNTANEDSLDRNVRQSVGIVLVDNVSGTMHFLIEDEDLLESPRFDGWDNAAPSVAAGATITLNAKLVDKYGVAVSGRYQVYFSLSGGGAEWDTSAAGSITITENVATKAGVISAENAEVYYTGANGQIDLDFDKAAAGTGWARLNGPDGGVKTSFLTWT